MTLSRADFSIKPTISERPRPWSIYYGPVWIAYADDLAHAGELIAACIDMHGRGFDDARIEIKRALGL